MLAAALSAYDAGLQVIQVKTDRSKTPVNVPGWGAIDKATGKRKAGWQRFQIERPDRDTVAARFADNHPGIGLVCGTISGNLEMLEVEGSAVNEGMLDRLADAIKAAELDALFDRILNGYYERTPRNGVHLVMRVTDGPAAGNQKLAMRPPTAAEVAEAEAKGKSIKSVTMIETRGEGGFVVVAPSHGPVHKDGDYTMVRGGFDTIATVTTAERDAIYAVCRSLSEMPADEPAPKPKPVDASKQVKPRPWTGGTVGASWMDATVRHLAGSTSMRSLLERYGWEHAHDGHGVTYMRHPTATNDVSAVINDNDRLLVFSTSTSFTAYTGTGPTPTYDLLDVVAEYEHRGDRKAAAMRIADDAGIMAAWQRQRSDADEAAMREWIGTAPANVDPVTGEILDGDGDGDGDDGDAAWRPVDLAAAWSGERTEPAAVVLHRCDGMALYPPGINYLYGDSGDGKTWVMQMAAVQAMKAGQHVIWVTYEDANELEMVKRLRLLGATAADLVHLSLIVANEPFIQAPVPLARLARQRNTALLVLDSVGEALAVDGVDEDKDAQFAPWARDTLRCIIDLAAGVAWRYDGTADNERLAVVPIDHSTKAKDNPFFPSGTKRKRSMLTGLMLMVNVRQAFAIGRVGRVQLIASKDRSGRFRRGEIVAEVVLDATDTPYGFTVEPPPAGADMATVGRKRKAEERVLQALDLAGVPMSAEQIVRQVNHADNRLPGEADLSTGTVKNALTKLAKRPNVRQEKVPTGVGKAHRHLYLVTDHKDDAAGGDS
jgi:hypothetical protein